MSIAGPGATNLFTAAAYAQLGAGWLSVGNREQAAASYAEALRLDPMWESARRGLGLAQQGL